MKIIKLFLPIILLLFFASCNINKEKVSIIEFELFDEIILDIEDFSKNIPYDMQLINEEGRDLLILYLNNKKLLIYDYETRELINTINLDWKQLLCSYYVNKDSIYVYYNASYNEGYMHDSILQLIDKNSNIKNNYSFKGSPVWCSENLHYNKDSVSYSGLFFQNLPYSRQKIFMNFIKYNNSYIGDSSFLSPQLPLVGYFDTQENKFIVHDKITFPFFKEGIYYPEIMKHVSVSISKNNNPVYSFKYTPIFYEYNIKTDEISSNSLKSKLIDTILPTKEPCSDFKTTELAYYKEILFNSFNNLNYRLIYLPEAIYGEERYSVIIADSNYNYIAEGIIPEGHYVNKVMFKNEHIIIFNAEKTFANEGKVFFSVFKLNITKGEEEGINISENRDTNYCSTSKNNDENSNKNIIEYVTNLTNIHDSSYAITIVPANSCPSCIEVVLESYKLNKEVAENSNIYLILSTNNLTQAKSMLIEKNLYISKNIFIDEEEEYLNYHTSNSFNPRLIIIKNNEIVWDTIYNPTEMVEEYMDKIIDFHQYIHE